MARTKIQETTSTRRSARENPISGERTIAAAVLPRPAQTMADSPTLAIPEPTRPPINACELLDGMPSHQVTMFQVMAPISAPKITCASTTSAPTIPVPMVLATCRPKNRKATKLKTAAQMTA